MASCPRQETQRSWIKEVMLVNTSLRDRDMLRYFLGLFWNPNSDFFSFSSDHLGTRNRFMVLLVILGCAEKRCYVTVEYCSIFEDDQNFLKLGSS